MTQHWDELSPYESMDIVKATAKRCTNRTPSTGRALEAISAFGQGREYFAAAASAGALVRPLLQYYGVLSISRGAIALLSPMEPPAQHGLTTVQFDPAKDDLSNFRIKVTKGTFHSLLVVTKNRDRSAGWEVVRDGNDLIDIEFTLGDVLARIPELRSVYERSLDRCAATCRARFQTTAGQKLIFQRLYRGSRMTLAEFQTMFETPASVQITDGSFYEGSFWELAQVFEVYFNQPNQPPQPQIDELSDGSFALVARFVHKAVLSRIGRFFIASFILGTLVRYFPKEWLDIMQGRGTGNALLPIFRSAMDAIQSEFPALVAKEIRGY